MNRPNILWICTDQQRYDTIHRVSNPEINTPNLDRLCDEGVAFTRAYCQSPICSPSRASFLTGLDPGYVGVSRNGLEDFPSKPNAQLITKRLADAGYDCGLSGKLHIASAWNGREKRVDDGYREFHYSHGPTQGIEGGVNDYVDWVRDQGAFDEVFDTSRYDPKRNSGCRFRDDIPAKYHQTTWCADRAIDFINDHAADGSHAGKPWLFSCNIFDPHPAFDAPRSYAERYDPDAIAAPIFGPNDLELQERLSDAFFQGKPTPPGENQLANKANYYGMVELIDENVGRMIAALEVSGQRENTVIIFTSDHGENLGDHGLTGKGCRFYEGAVRVPLIISWPGQFVSNVVAEGLAALTDLAPTIAELTGLEALRSHGSSLVPILNGASDPDHHHEFVRCEYYDTLDMTAPYTGRGDHRESWATMYRDERWKLIVHHSIGYAELYDLENDPQEIENLWDVQSARETRDRLVLESFNATVSRIDIGPPLIGRY